MGTTFPGIRPKPFQVPKLVALLKEQLHPQADAHEGCRRRPPPG